MPEAFNIVQYLGIASVYLLHHELKSWCEMSSTFSTWIKAAIMTATHCTKPFESFDAITYLQRRIDKLNMKDLLQYFNIKNDDHITMSGQCSLLSLLHCHINIWKQPFRGAT